MNYVCLRGRPPLAPLRRAASALASERTLPPLRPKATAAGFLRGIGVQGFTGMFGGVRHAAVGAVTEFPLQAVRLASGQIGLANGRTDNGGLIGCEDGHREAIPHPVAVFGEHAQFHVWANSQGKRLFRHTQILAKRLGFVN